MYNLQPVNHGTSLLCYPGSPVSDYTSCSVFIAASLRPPDPNQTKETKGRKSNKRAQAKAAKLREEEGEVDDEDDEHEEVEEQHKDEGRSAISLPLRKQKMTNEASFDLVPHFEI
jgi:hypothetical protein